MEDTLSEFLRKHSLRFGKFSVVGAFTLILGFVLLYVGVHWLGMSKSWAYLAQGIISIETNFALNRRFTWRDTEEGWWSSWLKWHTGKVFTVPVNQGIFMLLIHWNVQYLLANFFTDAIFAVINYTIGHAWAFAHRPKAVQPAEEIPRLRLSERYPTVSVIVPVKNSQKTIGQLVESLLAQDYYGEFEVILVGDVGDQTWESISSLLRSDPRLRYIEMETCGFGRDCNEKRNRGLELARGEILALTDSDMVLPSNWLILGVEAMAKGWHCVAGGMVSAHQNFWGRYVDSNVLGGKTPRIAEQYVVDMKNFGGPGTKPPITANVIFSRQLLRDVGGLDNNMTLTYDDYEWFWRVAASGYQTLMLSELNARHHHRQGVNNLSREYWQSGGGCVEFIVRHPKSLLAVRRKRQLMAVLVAFLASIGCYTAAAVTQELWPLSVIVAAGITSGGLGIIEAYKTKNKEAVFYPLVTFLLGSVFSAGMVRRYAFRHFRPSHHSFHSYVPEVATEPAA